MNTYSFAGGTDVGKVRDHNEDNYHADPENGFFLVSDGMGGHQCGEVASEVVVNSVAADVVRGMTLADAVGRAHHAVIEAGRTGKGSPDMGATAVALRLDQARYEIAWVGDSRAYLWDGNVPRQLTRDHSFVQQMIDAGALTEADAKNHPQKNVITQALGASHLPEVDVGSVSGTLYQEEKILLCSDGLTGELEDGEIADILAMPGTEQEAADRLIESANAHGGEDNITVILVSAPADAPPRAGEGGTVPMKAITLDDQPKTDEKRPIYLYIVILAVVFVIVLLTVIT